MPKLWFLRLFLLFFAALFSLKLSGVAQSASPDTRAIIRTRMVEFLRYAELEKNVSPTDLDNMVELWTSASQPELSLDARQQAFRDLYLLYYKVQGIDLSSRPQAMSALAQRAAASMQSGARLDLRLPTPRGPLMGNYLHIVTQGRGKEHMLLIADGGIDGRELYRSFIARHRDHYTMHIVTLPGAGLAKRMPWPEVYDLTRRPWLNHIEQSLQSLLAKIARDKLVVVGTASGGYFAARLALTKPEKIRAVVLVDALVNLPMTSRSNPGKPAALKERLAILKTYIPMPFFYPAGEVPGRTEINKLLNTPNNTHPAVQNWMAFAVRDEALSKAWSLAALSNGFFAPGLRFGAELQTTDLTEDLQQLAVPMLAMCAMPDPGSPRMSAAGGAPLLSAPGWQEIKRLYPNLPLTVAVYHDTRSYISEDSPREFDRDLSDFLAGKPVAGKAAQK